VTLRDVNDGADWPPTSMFWPSALLSTETSSRTSPSYVTVGVMSRMTPTVR
jgi:hypothetical protein